MSSRGVSLGGLCHVFVFLLLMAAPVSGDSTWLDVYYLNEGEDLSSRTLPSGNPGHRFHMTDSEVYGIVFTAHYVNPSTDTDYHAYFLRHTKYEMPEYVEGWTDQDFLLPAGQDTVIQQTVFIRPREVGVDSFAVITMLRRGTDRTDPGWWDADAGVFVMNLKIHSLDEAYRLPVLVVDAAQFSPASGRPGFSPGYSNALSWKTAAGDGNITRIFQDGYAFDTENPRNLLLSVQGLYKDASETVRSARFENLEHGHTYGYFVKAVYESAQDTLSLYTDFVYSTQDAFPPVPVEDAHADLREETGTVKLWWESVDDEVSGIAAYRIYRAADTQTERLIHTYPADPVQPDYYTWEERIPEAGMYHYRVRPVDFVGNEGEGMRTEGILWEDGDPGGEDEGPGDENTVEPGAGPEGFLRGPVDTLWTRLKGWEKDLRFIAVRDDSSLFVMPPGVGMRRFDSGWIGVGSMPSDPLDPNRVGWEFDYSLLRETGETVDLNFVDNHVYYRWVIRRSLSGFMDTVYVGTVVPDCFPPSDIRNPKAVSVLDSVLLEGSEPRSLDWRMMLSWEPATDEASGLKTYHVYRKVHGIDDGFTEIGTGDPPLTTPSFLDTYHPSGDGIANPLISYRVTGEDWVGNRRELPETVWEAGDRALNAPFLAFADTASAEVYQYRVDTLITKQEHVLLRLTRFDISEVEDFVVSINGWDTVFENGGSGVLDIPLPIGETMTDFHIRVRARYRGKRSSLWSKQVVIILEANRPPSFLTASNESPGIGTGDIQLRWDRPSLDVVDYEVWRWDESGTGSLAAVVPSEKPMMEWVDRYGIDETTGLPGDTLVAFEMYTYRVRVINLFQDTTEFSIPSAAYCRKSPELLAYAVEKRNEEDVIVVSWKRALPTRALGSWSTHVRVSKDSLPNLVYDSDSDGMHVVDDTSFIFDDDIQSGHNYIFQIKEVPRPPAGRESHWSMPYTVNLARIDSLFIQSQPGGAIYLTWEADTLVDVLPVDVFEVTRLHDGETVRRLLPRSQVSYLDTAGLIHGETYTYDVSALNSLGQIVAARTVEAVSDTGFVFIPIIDRAQYLYFNSDSITVNWHWETIQGEALEEGTRGAVFLRIEMSVSRLFPEDDLKTKTTEWFAARTGNGDVRKMCLRVPEAVDINNEVVHCRITATDRWGLPASPVWSRPVKFVYDVIRPESVEESGVVSVEAYYGRSDSVIIEVAWKDLSILHKDRTLANVDYYRVLYTLDGTEVEAGLVPVTGGVSEYMFRDTLANRYFQWRVVSVDSASNVTEGLSFEPERFLTTPSPPTPTGFKSCRLDAMEPDTGDVEYFVEIALDPSHFLLGYEMEVLAPNRLLCQSGWFPDTVFACGSGWGAVTVDTTWFRVKARRGEEWESGWSSLNYHTDGGGGTLGASDGTGEKPDRFEVLPAYPNPFNATTVIPYRMPDAGRLSVTVYDVLGTPVKTLFDGEQEAGEYTAVWDGMNQRGMHAPTGMYFIRILVTAGGKSVYSHRLKTMLIK